MRSNPLPPEHAFLVQLGRDVQLGDAGDAGDAALERFTGRVEHLESGRRARFGSRDELFAALAEMLARRPDAGGAEPDRQPEPEDE